MNRLKLYRISAFLKSALTFPYIKGNARALLIFEPFFCILFSSVNYFYPLYMQTLGLSNTSIGLIASIGTAFALIFSLVSGYITDRLGRKKTLFIFDTLAWTLPFLIWAAARNFWHFLTAFVLNNTVKIAGVGWICLIVDDTDERDRTSVFTVMSIITLCAGLFTPIAGRIIVAYGLVTTMRAIYFILFLYMVFMVIMRDRWTHERPISKALTENHKTLSMKGNLLQYYELLRSFTQRPSILFFLLMFALSGFQGGLLIFRIIYLKDVLVLSEASISILPFVASIAMLVVYIGIIPAVARQHNEYNFLCIGGLISVVGAVLFIVAGAGAVGLMFSSIIITALGDALASPFKQSCFNNMIGAEHRAKALSINYTLTALCAIPSGIIAGILYKSNPVYPFILSLVFLGINFALCFVVYLLEGRVQKHSTTISTNM